MSRSAANKTERPTPRRLRKARREGQVAKSQEVAVALSLVGAALGLRIFGPSVAATLLDETRLLLAHAGAGLGPHVTRGATTMLVRGIAPFAAFAVVLGVAAGVAQVGFSPAPAAAKPKLSNLSPRKGLERFRPSVAGWELARTAGKLLLLAAVVAGPLGSWIPTLTGTRAIDAALGSVASQALTLIGRAAILAALIAIADYSVQRFRISKQLRMTREEVRQEYKDTEGDPHLRAARRRRAQELTRNRMIFEVSTADVVVTNPTHFAVALRYRPPEPAPRVVAKGTENLAARIRAEAYRHGVPVVEDKPLARALYRQAKVGAYVPTALYEAAAVVLAVAYRRRRRTA